MNCPFQIFHWTKMLSAELWISVCQLSLSPDRNFRAKVACWKLGAAFFWEKKCQPKLIQDIVWNNYMISRLCYLPNSCLNTWFAKRPFNKEYWIQLVFRISFAMSKGLYYLPFASTRPGNIQVANGNIQREYSSCQAIPGKELQLMKCKTAKESSGQTCLLFFVFVLAGRCKYTVTEMQ